MDRKLEGLLVETTDSNKEKQDGVTTRYLLRIYSTKLKRYIEIPVGVQGMQYKHSIEERSSEYQIRSIEVPLMITKKDILKGGYELAEEINSSYSSEEVWRKWRAWYRWTRWDRWKRGPN